MEFHGTPWNSIEFHGVSWNSMEFYGSTMEFHGSSMELHGVPWKLHGIPWSCMEAPWNSMEFHGSSMEFHGVPWKPQGRSWSSMEAPWKPMESIEVSWNIGGVPWKLTEFHCVTHNSLKIKEWVIPTNNYSKWQQCIFHVRGHNYIDGTAAYQWLLRTVKLVRSETEWPFWQSEDFFKLLYQLIIFCTELQAVQFGKHLTAWMGFCQLAI